MKYDQDLLETDALMATARAMAVAARTAPKARGVDEIVTLLVTGEEIGKLADEMLRVGEEKNIMFFSRDSLNIRNVKTVLIVGVRNKPRAVPNCGYCGHADCAANTKVDGVCALCIVDLGIALGSAVSVAADHRVDTRVMFTIGKAALTLGFLEGVYQAYGLPLSATGKSPFFDRK